jgi:hypothetical protein
LQLEQLQCSQQLQSQSPRLRQLHKLKANKRAGSSRSRLFALVRQSSYDTSSGEAADPTGGAAGPM